MGNALIRIGSAATEPGHIGQGYIEVGALAMGAKLQIPVIVVNGATPGPTLWLNGAVHGDELNAFMVMRRLAAELNPKALAGALVCTPVCNPLAVHGRNKINFYDYLDLDQQFPGDSNGTYSQRLANTLFQLVREHATHLINFHTVGTAFTAQPYTVYKLAPELADADCESIENMALSFGAHANCRVDLGGATSEIPGGVAGALDINCSLAGIPAFMAEIGSGGEFQRDAIEFGIEGVRSVMAHLEMLESTATRQAEQIVITERTFVYTNEAGFWAANAAPGDKLAGDCALGRVIDLFSDLEQAIGPEGSHVIMSRRDPVLHTGDRLAFLGTSWRTI